MSRPGEGARPRLRPEKRNPEGTLRERRDWPRKISTGCPPEDRTGAERALGKDLETSETVPAAVIRLKS